MPKLRGQKDAFEKNLHWMLGLECSCLDCDGNGCQGKIAHGLGDSFIQVGLAAIIGQVASAPAPIGSVQWFFFWRNIGQLILKIIYFHYLKKIFSR